MTTHDKRAGQPDRRLSTSFPVSVKGVLLVNAQIVLIKNLRNEWELPGGRIEKGEDPVETLAREFSEELAVQVSVCEPIDAYLFEVTRGRYVFIVTYGCTLAGKFNPQISREHTEFRLCTVNELAEVNLPAGYRRSAEKWANGI